MKVAVTMNYDGHFLASLIDNREKTIEVLKTVHDGEMWEDYLEDALDACDLKEEDLFICPLNRFEQFIAWFEERGTFEIVEL